MAIHQLRRKEFHDFIAGITGAKTFGHGRSAGRQQKSHTVDAAATVRDERDTSGVSGGGNAASIGKAAGPCEIRLKNVSCVIAEKFAKTVDGRFMLTAGNARAADLLAEPGVTIDIIGKDRFFEEVETGLGNALGKLDRVRHVPGAKGIKHQERILTDALARFENVLHVGAHSITAGAEVDKVGQFDSTKAELQTVLDIVAGVVTGNAIPVLATEQPVDGEAGPLAGDVPKREIDSAHGLHYNTTATVEGGGGKELIPEQLDIRCIGADEEAAEVGFNNVARGGTAATHTVSGDAFLCTDLDENCAIQLGERPEITPSAGIEIRE